MASSTMMSRDPLVTARIVLLAAALACDGARRDPHAGQFQGVVELDERVLAFEIPGRVLAVAVTEGRWLEAGDEIARLDDTLERLQREAREAEARAARAELELLRVGPRPEDIAGLRDAVTAARAEEALARSELDRQRRLAATGTIPPAQLERSVAVADQATARRQGAESRLAALRKGARKQEREAARARAAAAATQVRAADERLRRHVLRADRPGLVLDVHLEPYEFANVGTPVVTVGDVRRPYVDIFVPQARIAEAVLGGPARVEVEAAALPLRGRVEYIGNRMEFTPRFLFSERELPNLVIPVRVRIDDPDATLRAGAPAFVTLQDV
ncbi:HlyD family efflux transporter periplasmic adaptor subunit [Nannocystis pusilla]|uniref:HlyD family efflux transporter periplasmic adaptor subunit n=1 Tax=Nannocystis pusilla TaxID=889268 RepID=A0A9X3IZN3_9BACT|nr:HlyD family efflux transporter periplasmic adaptor subunit [Nannocystis pusilla]MCY1009716.1 HlyD family efflux transporter periplasmic adaptor subunit [Nannocystis pusilla]